MCSDANSHFDRVNVTPEASNASVQLLAARQNALVAEIFNAPRSSHRPSGMDIYRSNLIFSAARALTISYPVTSAMLGEQTIQALAVKLLQYSPPVMGDWAVWGAALADYIATTPLAREHPYLCDIATLEWQLHRRARVAVPDLNKLSLKLLHEDLASIYLRLSPSITVMQSDFHCQALWQSHQQQAGEINFNSNLFNKLVSEIPATGYWLLQSQPRPKVRAIQQEEVYWLRGIQTGWSVDALLTHFPDFDFAPWLAGAIQHGLITGLTQAINHC